MNDGPPQGRSEKRINYVKFRRGEYQSKICPYGYQKGAGGRLEPDGETAPVVRLIFELAQSGRNKQEIIDELFKRKIQTPSEYKAAKGQAMNGLSRCRGIWSHATLRHLLSDERLM